MPSPRETLRALLDAALAAALPERVVAAHLPAANELPAPNHHARSEASAEALARQRTTTTVDTQNRLRQASVVVGSAPAGTSPKIMGTCPYRTKDSNGTR